MKLYTEEQVKQMIKKSRETGLTAEYLVLTTTPIELPSDTAEDTADYIDRHIVEAMVEVAKKPINFPSDEEIEEYSLHYSEMQEDVSDKLGKYLVKAVHMDGAQWVINKIQEGNQ